MRCGPGCALFVCSVILLVAVAPSLGTPLEGLYLGQEPPGEKPAPFAPGIVSTDEQQGCSLFLEEGSLFIFNVFRNRKSYLYEMALVDGRWTEPRLSSLSSEYYDGDFTLAPDGATLMFSSRRPLHPGEPEREHADIWRVRRTASGWGEPSPLGSPINTDDHEAYPTLTRDGTLYFFARGRGGSGESDLFRSRLVSGEYTHPENLGSVLNTEGHEWDPWVAPDESFLIFCSKKPAGYGEDDLYVSFKGGDGSWREPVNLGEDVNSEESENRPCMTWDGKYLFFTSNRSGDRDIYWVDATIIDRLKTEQQKQGGSH